MRAMKVINSIGDAELRRVAERRYPYLSRYGCDMPMHLACCLCYPRPLEGAKRGNEPPVAWDRHLIYRKEAV